MAPYLKNLTQALQKAAGKNLARFLGISAIALLLAPSALLPIKATAQEIQRDSASVIMYHRFGEDRYPSTNIRLSQFEEHLELLTNGDYTVLPLPEIIETLRAGGTVPDRTVAITIDDAYLSVYEQAWPRLKALGLPFTIFVATEPVEKNRRGYMSWDMLRELQSAGVTIGSQTHTHPHLHRKTPEQVRAEINLSNQYFLQELGMRPQLFAYPFGEYSRFVVDIVKESALSLPLVRILALCIARIDFELPRFAFNENYGTTDRLELAVNGLPLKITDLTPEDMVLSENPPLYGFTLHEDMRPEGQLRCFASGYGKVSVSIIGRRAEIRLPGALKQGRSRINCTMPAGQNRWRWFGRQFLTN